MFKWIKVAAPVALAAIVVSVLAIGFGSPQGKAAECLGEGVGTTGMTGKAPSSFQFDYCSSPSLGLSISLTWAKSGADLGLLVTEPDGTQHFADGHNTTIENFVQNAPLPEGTWNVEVFNNKKGPVSYGLTVRFVCQDTSC